MGDVSVLAPGARDTQLAGIILFGSLQVDVNNKKRVFERGRQIRLGTLQHRLLIYLVMHQHRVCTSAELRAYVWGDVFVSDNTFRRLLDRLRESLHSQSDITIRTVRERGYQIERRIQAAA